MDLKIGDKVLYDGRKAIIIGIQHDIIIGFKESTALGWSMTEAKKYHDFKNYNINSLYGCERFYFVKPEQLTLQKSLYIWI